MQNLYDIANGKLKLNLHSGQRKAWKSKARFTFIFAGTQGGKTSFLPWWLYREIQRTAVAGELNDYIACTATFDLFKLKFLPALREVFEHELGCARYWAGDRVLELQDPRTGKFWADRSDDRMYARIVLRSAAGGGGLESLTARGAAVDECGQDEFTLETWEAILRRLSIYQGRVMGGTTIYNLGWTKTEVYDRWRRGDVNYNVVQFVSTANPQFPPEELERARATMPAHRFAMFYRGEFGRPAGMIYDCWSEQFNIVDDFELSPKWPRYVGIDFGAVNTALIWIAHDTVKDVFYAYRESLEGGLSTKEHCGAANAFAAAENVVMWLGGSPSEEQQRWDWAEAGVPVIRPFVSDVEGGIQRVYGLMKPRRLKVFRSCAGLLDEIGTYKRKLDEQGQATSEILDKRKFHRLDALRYVCSGLDSGTVQYGSGIY